MEGGGMLRNLWQKLIDVPQNVHRHVAEKGYSSTFVCGYHYMYVSSSELYDQQPIFNNLSTRFVYHHG